MSIPPNMAGPVPTRAKARTKTRHHHPIRNTLLILLAIIVGGGYWLIKTPAVQTAYQHIYVFTAYVVMHVSKLDIWGLEGSTWHRWNERLDRAGHLVPYPVHQHYLDLLHNTTLLREHTHAVLTWGPIAIVALVVLRLLYDAVIVTKKLSWDALVGYVVSIATGMRRRPTFIADEEDEQPPPPNPTVGQPVQVLQQNNNAALPPPGWVLIERPLSDGGVARYLEPIHDRTRGRVISGPDDPNS